MPLPERRWFPDEEFRADWATRFETVLAALRSLGYVVEHVGRGTVPVQYRSVSMLVYQMEPGKAPPQRSDDAWAYVPPDRSYKWPERSPLDQCRRTLRDLGITMDNRDRRYLATLWAMPSVLWPPRAVFCAQLRWWPEPGNSAKETAASFGQLLKLVGTRYRTRRPLRGSVAIRGHVDVLVYREAPEDAESTSASAA